MTNVYRTVGQAPPATIGKDWALVFGGVSRQGNRRARRACDRALQDYDVVWFDGFEEEHPENGDRMPLEGDGRGELTVIGFAEAESRTLAGRMRIGAGLASRPSTRWIWRNFTRRIGSILRPMACWSVIKSDVLALSGSRPPVLIIYGDDYAITSAWHAGKIWPGVPIVAEVPDP
ncbi:MAG TPA: hypothetical protein VJ858_03535 [Acidimicrobiia bacterium]|nr:hypothetical protein [Acidimicrobiia bacterium]